ALLLVHAARDGVRAALRPPAERNVLLSSRALDHDVWQRFGTEPAVERDRLLAPDGTRTAERVLFAGASSMLVQFTNTPARGGRFLARVWLRRAPTEDADAADAADAANAADAASATNAADTTAARVAETDDDIPPHAVDLLVRIGKDGPFG